MFIFAETEFATCEVLVSYAKQAANEAGYALVLRRTHTDRAGNARSVELKCDLGGEYTNRHVPSEDARIRQTAIRLEQLSV